MIKGNRGISWNALVVLVVDVVFDESR